MVSKKRHCTRKVLRRTPEHILNSCCITWIAIIRFILIGWVTKFVVLPTLMHSWQSLAFLSQGFLDVYRIHCVVAKTYCSRVSGQSIILNVRRARRTNGHIPLPCFVHETGHKLLLYILTIILMEKRQRRVSVVTWAVNEPSVHVLGVLRT